MCKRVLRKGSCNGSFSLQSLAGLLYEKHEVEYFYFTKIGATHCHAGYVLLFLLHHHMLLCIVLYICRCLKVRLPVLKEEGFFFAIMSFDFSQLLSFFVSARCIRSYSTANKFLHLF